MKRILIIAIMAIWGLNVNGQTLDGDPFKHHHVTFTIGHALIPTASRSGSGEEAVLTPTLGIAYEYLINEKIGLGLKSDLEISTYVLTKDDGTEIDREFPFSTTLIIRYNPIQGLGFYFGPGIEFETNENFWLINMGVSYEMTFYEYFDVSPELGYELKNGEAGVLTYGISLGARLGKK